MSRVSVSRGTLLCLGCVYPEELCLLQLRGLLLQEQHDTGQCRVLWQGNNGPLDRSPVVNIMAVFGKDNVILHLERVYFVKVKSVLFRKI